MPIAETREESRKDTLTEKEWENWEAKLNQRWNHKAQFKNQEVE